MGYGIHHSYLHCIPLCQDNILFEKKVFILSVSELLDINIFTTTAMYIHVNKKTCLNQTVSDKFFCFGQQTMPLA